MYKIGKKFFSLREEHWSLSPESPGNPGVPDLYSFEYKMPKGETIVLRHPATFPDRYYASCSGGYINGWFSKEILLEYFEPVGEQLLCL